MSIPREEQGQPEVNPDDENEDFDSTGAGEADVDPDDDTEADYEDTPADDDLRDAENRVKAGNTGAESTGPNQPASAADPDPGQ
ncbi:hypothetical protein [Microbacterium sp. A93]|uniref:hypothetical protein n=1 Tax=Microbacterium sp. A93 TaxID=3450716 RepID=UPI003F441160